MQFDHFLDVRKTEAEALDVVLVACMNTIELVEDALQIVLLYADSIVCDTDAEVRLALIESVNLDAKRLIFASVLEGVVQQIEYNVSEMHFVGIDEGIVSLQSHVERASDLRYLEREGVYHVLGYLVGIELLHL